MAPPAFGWLKRQVYKKARTVCQTCTQPDKGTLLDSAGMDATQNHKMMADQRKTLEPFEDYKMNMCSRGKLLWRCHTQHYDTAVMNDFKKNMLLSDIQCHQGTRSEPPSHVCAHQVHGRDSERGNFLVLRIIFYCQMKNITQHL